jgi:threonyl-tRNA synthetase
MERRFGYSHILTPHLNKKELFEISGHLGFYADSMYPSMTYEEKDDSGRIIGQNEVYYPKPMNCPAGMMVYKLKNHSYRELPIKMGEFGTVYRAKNLVNCTVYKESVDLRKMTLIFFALQHN